MSRRKRQQAAAVLDAMAPPPPMDKGTLIFLAGNLVLMKMVNSWPNVKRHRTRAKTEESWAKTAGLALADVKRGWDVLFDNRIITRSGGVDPFAQKFVENEVMKELKRLRRAP